MIELNERQDIGITGEFITLGQLLQKVGTIDTGGQAKPYLEENPVWVNEQVEQRRGKKIYPGDEVRIDDRNVIHVTAGDS